MGHPLSAHSQEPPLLYPQPRPTPFIPTARGYPFRTHSQGPPLSYPQLWVRKGWPLVPLVPAARGHPFCTHSCGDERGGPWLWAPEVWPQSRAIAFVPTATPLSCPQPGATPFVPAAVGTKGVAPGCGHQRGGPNQGPPLSYPQPHPFRAHNQGPPLSYPQLWVRKGWPLAAGTRGTRGRPFRTHSCGYERGGPCQLGTRGVAPMRGHPFSCPQLWVRPWLRAPEGWHKSGATPF